jgi:hypothetical protein
MAARGDQQLHSDPCVYIWHNGDEYSIITIWVDDLLLFATLESILIKMANDLHAEWEITDLSEPAKIIGIEITHTKDSIILLQK